MNERDQGGHFLYGLQCEKCKFPAFCRDYLWFCRYFTLPSPKVPEYFWFWPGKYILAILFTGISITISS
jgi:hypothetical protein